MKRLLLIILIINISGCAYFTSDKKEEKESENHTKVVVQIHKKNFEDRSVLLAYKNSLSVEDTQNLLLAYFEKYDNFNFRILTDEKFKFENSSGNVNEPMKLESFIIEYSNSSLISTNSIGAVLFDYKYFELIESIEFIREDIRNIEYDISNLNIN